MGFQVRTSKAAGLQIETTYLWLKKRNKDYADEWFKGLMNAIASLQEKPRRCSLAIEHEVFNEEVRQLIYGKARNRYRILFTIREDVVYVLFVRHTSQSLLTGNEIGDED
ncbi:MAG: type II toxin-antitoxin system RelE/ParE family toxin [Cyanobacteria bacterium P01_F01_bin.143]